MKFLHILFIGIILCNYGISQEHKPCSRFTKYNQKTVHNKKVLNNTFKTAGDIFWEEDFDSIRWSNVTPENMPNLWKVNDLRGKDFYWIWSKEGPKGRYTSPNSGPGVLKVDNLPDNDGIEDIDEIGGTASNGFLLLNGDWYNTGDDGQIVEDTVCMDSYVQVSGIDLSEAPGVILHYNQMYRWCCSWFNKLSVFVSVDYNSELSDDQQNPNWIEFDGKGLNASLNDQTDEKDRHMMIDLTDIAAGQSNVTIRFHKQGASHYYWMIDDIKFIEPNSYDLKVDRAWWFYGNLPEQDADIDYDWNGGYAKIPISQVQDFVGFKMAVSNIGLEEENKAQLKVTVTKNGELIFNETSSPKSIPYKEKDTINLLSNFTPLEIGEYVMKSNIVGEFPDEDTTNNSWEYKFIITDTVYSRAYDPPYSSNTSTGAWVSGGNPGDALMSKFEIINEVEAKSISVYFGENDDTEQEINIEAGNFSMIGRMYIEDQDQVSKTTLISTDLKQMLLDERNSFVTMNYRDNINKNLSSGVYYPAIETYTNYYETDFEIGEDNRILQPDDNAYAWFSGMQGNINSNPVINLNIASKEYHNVTFIVKTRDFDVKSMPKDSIYLVANFNEFLTQNLNNSYLLRDNNNDGTYKIVLSLEAGEYAYNVFRKSTVFGDENMLNIDSTIIVNSDSIFMHDWNLHPSHSAEILNYSIENELINSSIDSINRTIDILVDLGVDKSDLKASFSLSEKATAFINDIIQISGVNSNDFIDTVEYKIIAEDDTTINYWNVIVNERDAYTDTDIISFSMENQIGETIINSEELTVDIVFPFGTDLSTLVAYFNLSEAATAYVNDVEQISGSTVNDFSETLEYRILAEDGITESKWTIVSSTLPSTESLITSFSFEEETKPTVINIVNKTVLAEISLEANIVGLSPSFTLSEGAVASINGVEQVSGESIVDFSETVVYRVDAMSENDSSIWNVIVKYEPSHEAEILSYSIENQISEASIDSINRKIDVLVDFGVDLSSLKATFTLSENAKATVNDVMQYSDVSTNDFSDTVIYEIVAEDDTTIQRWSVIVSESEPLIATQILSFAISGQIGETSIDAENKIVSLFVSESTDITSLVPEFETSEGGKAYINEEEQFSGISVVDFTDTVIYNIVAEDINYSTEWKVFVKNSVSISNIEMSNVTVYPNPSKGFLYIRNAEDCDVNIFNVLGDRVYQLNVINQLEKVDLQFLHNGLYFIKISKENQIKILRVQISK
jgi:Secretion system C-terminal sorting domain